MAGTPVQNALTALVPLKAEFVDAVREQLKGNPINPEGLDAVGTVHFARIFVTPEDSPAHIPSNLLAVITSYDNSFRSYIQAFVNQPAVAGFFDHVLAAIDDPDAASIIPVTKNAAAFAALVEKYDITNPDLVPWGQWYSAYPDKTVQEILHG